MDKNCVLVSVLQIPRHHGIRFKKFDTYFGILQANRIVFTISLPKLLPELNRSEQKLNIPVFTIYLIKYEHRKILMLRRCTGCESRRPNLELLTCHTVWTPTFPVGVCGTRKQGKYRLSFIFIYSFLICL